MSVLKVKNNGVWEYVMGGSSSQSMNGGNADTVDGKHASDFASSSDLDQLQNLVGGTSVSEQIANAIVNKSDVDHTHDDKYYTESEIDTKLSDKADTSHTHDEYVNQNAFSNITVGSTTVVADSATDTLTLVAGNNVTITPDVTNDKITIAATDTIYSVATTSSDGLMSAADKTKLDSVTAGASGITVDDALSSTSTNPVQNKVVNNAISNLNTLVGGTSVSEQIASAISNKVDKVEGKGLSTNDYTTTEKNKLSGIASGAEVNQNAFSNVAVGSTTIAADGKTDTLTLAAGDNITLTPDATNDKVTIAAKDTVYTHPSYTARTGVPTANATPAFGETFNISQPVSDATGHITAINSRTVTIPSATATTSTAGLMSAADKTKLDDIPAGANKTIVDSALSSTSTNPVQNKVVNSAIADLNTLVGSESVSSQISTAISNKADAATLNMKLYTNPTQFGSTASATATEILSAVPNDSMFIYSADSLSGDGWNFPYTYGMLQYIKYSSVRVKILFWGKQVGNGNYQMQVDSSGNPTGEWFLFGTPFKDIQYGSTLPDPGTKGRLFFKKVSS